MATPVQKARVRVVIALVLVGALLTFTRGVAAAEGAAAQPAVKWYEVKKGKVQIHLYVFYRETCAHCAEANTFLAGLARRHGWLSIHYYEVSRYPGNLAYYQQMAEGLGKNAGLVPAFFYCKQFDMGFDRSDTTGARLERALIRYQEALQKQVDRKKPAAPAAPAARGALAVSAGALAVIGLAGPPAGGQPGDGLEDLLDEVKVPREEAFDVPGWGEVRAEGVSLPALTAWLGALDSVNPCAFFVLTILLSLMLRTGSRGRMLLVGGVFVFFSGLVYFLFMAAWLNLFFLVGHLRWITAAAGVVAVVVGLINVKDFFWFKSGVTLSLSESAKERLFRRMNVLMSRAGVVPLLGGTAALAFAANLYELLCTSGLPMVYTRVLTLRELPALGYYGYLVLYNVVYVTPLALIVLVFAVTLSSHKLTEYQGRVLKLLSGLMMLALGVVLIAWPEVLNSLLGAAGTVLGSVALTGAVVAGERAVSRWRSGSGPGAAGEGGELVGAGTARRGEG